MYLGPDEILLTLDVQFDRGSTADEIVASVPWALIVFSPLSGFRQQPIKVKKVKARRGKERSAGNSSGPKTTTA